VLAVPARQLTLGARSYAVGPGRRTVVRVRLASTARSLMRGRRTLAARLYLRAGGRERSFAIKLRARR
jgi:hypothetical protein